MQVTLPTTQYVFKTYGLESRSDGNGPYVPDSRQLTIFHLRHYDSRVVVPVSCWSVTWLILPVVICLSQRLSHACLSTSLTKGKPRMAH